MVSNIVNTDTVTNFKVPKNSWNDMFTILHISDLHRSPQDPIDNDTLLEALLGDRDRYMLESPKLNSPNAIIVSGDVIQGVELGHKNFSAELDKQYETAAQFLNQLVDRFAEGDRRKIAIVPGNHDVCWNTAIDSMEKVGIDGEPRVAHPKLFNSTTNYRWDWKSREIYKISRQDIYRRRMDSYWKFVEHFYHGADLAFPIDRGRGFNLFEFDESKILVAGFESTYGNDCYCCQGHIEAGALGRCNIYLRDAGLNPVLRIATWHHSIQGPPGGDDYMDIATVHEMIGNGFRLGLHGHQHKADAEAYSINLPQQLSMSISSAGSLCAGDKELPRGTNREYNIISISETYDSARIHVREMTQGNQFGKCRRGQFNVDGYVDLTWHHPPSLLASSSRKKGIVPSSLVFRAEEYLKAGNAAEAWQVLQNLSPNAPSYARELYVLAAKRMERWPEILRMLATPDSPLEFSELINALLELKKYPDAKALLSRSSELQIPKSLAEDLSSKLDMMSRLSKVTE